MQTLGLAMRSSGEEGAALPPVFSQLDKLGAKLRRGQLVLIAGAPGGGKSAITSFLTYKMAYGEFEEQGVPTLYFSADTDKHTLGTRIAASISRFTVEQAEELLVSGHQGIWDMLESNTGHIWFSWDRGPTLEDIDEEVQAYATVVGDWPHVIVIDNLKNIWVDAPSEGGEHIRYDRVLDFLHELAGQTGACIIVLHHVTGYWENGNEPIPLSGILGKVTKPFRLILTLHKAWEGTLGVSIVKNSFGPMQADGRLIAYIPYDLSRMQFATD